MSRYMLVHVYQPQSFQCNQESTTQELTKVLFVTALDVTMHAAAAYSLIIHLYSV